jgi:hypothetical protein
VTPEQRGGVEQRMRTLLLLYELLPWHTTMPIRAAALLGRLNWDALHTLLPTAAAVCHRPSLAAELLLMPRE